MKLWTGVLAAASLIVASEATLVMAQERERHMGEMKESCSSSRETEHAQYRHYGHYPHHLIKHAKEIGLIPDQITRLKTIRLEFERVCLRARAEIGVSDLDIAALTDDQKADMKAIEAKVKQRATAVAGLQIAAVKAKRDAAALLTAEQREKDQAVHEKMMQQMQEQRGGMGGGMMQDDGQMGGGMDHDMMQGDQDDSSRQEESQDEHQNH